MIDRVISHDILGTNMMSSVNVKATSKKFLIIAQNRPNKTVKQRKISDIQRKTFEALSAE